MTKTETTAYEEDFFDHVTAHVSLTENINNLVLGLSWLACLVCAGLGVYFFFQDGDVIFASILVGVAVASALLSWLVWAVVQNWTNATELLVMIASADEPSG